MSGPDYGRQGWQSIDVSLDGPVAIVKLNRTKERNTFTIQLEQDLVEAYTFFDLDDRVRAVVLTADHTASAFCSGADISSGWDGLWTKDDHEQGRHTYRDSGGKVALAIFRCRKITIVAVNGHAAGVGFSGLQLPCDFRFIWVGAKLVLPFVRRGITAESASSYLLPRLLGYSRAVGMLLTGDTFSPDSPILQGMYQATFPNREDVFPAVLAFAHELAANTSQTSIAWTKALLWHGADSIEGQHIFESRAMSDLATRGDAMEGALAFKERRPVKFRDALSKDLSDFVPWWTELDVKRHRTKL